MMSGLGDRRERPHHRRRRATPMVVALLAGLLLVVAGASSASAHTELLRSDPRSGGTAAVGRTAMTLWFTEEVDLRSRDVTLTTLDGGEVPLTITSDPGDVVSMSMPPLARGTYVLDWHAVSLDDGHSSAGSVLFGVGVRPVVTSSGGTGLPARDGFTLRWLDLSALMLVGGSLAVSGRVLRARDGLPRSAQRRARLVGTCAAGVAVLTGLAAPLLITRSGGDSLGVRVHAATGLLSGTAWGHLWLAREAALVVVALAMLRWAAEAARLRPAGRTWRVAVVALAGALWCDAMAGHAASLPARSALAAVATAGHVAAASVWVGGLTVLTGCLMTVLWRAPELRPAVLGAVLRGYSPIAAVAAAVVLATGVYAAARQVPDVHALTSTVYGGAVVAKVALLALALSLATLNTLLVRGPVALRLTHALRRPAGWAPLTIRRLPGVVAAELAVLVVAVATAALLTSVPTAREATVTQQQTYLHAAHVDGLFVTLEDVPAGTGSSRVVVRTRSTVRPEIAPVDAVEVLLTGPTGVSDVPLSLVEPGRWDATTTELEPGAWSATVAIQRGDLPIATIEAHWVVAAPPGDGVGPLEAAAGALAILLLAGTALGVALIRRPGESAAIPAAPVPVTSSRS